jgi:hypothetical protein
VPGFPLPLRNALAALAIAALEEDDAAAALRWLVAPTGAPDEAAAARLSALHLVDPGAPALLAVHAPHAAGVSAHAAHALAARAAYRATHPAGPPAATAPVVRAVRQAAALWNARLFFEVHEVLEAVWLSAAGEIRHALQGVIQVAVAYHHLGHGNVRGARSLMSEGRGRLASVPPATLAPLDVEALLVATAAWDSARAGDPAPPVGPPRLVLRA